MKQYQITLVINGGEQIGVVWGETHTIEARSIAAAIDKLNHKTECYHYRAGSVLKRADSPVTGSISIVKKEESNNDC